MFGYKFIRMAIEAAVLAFACGVVIEVAQLLTGAA